MSGICELAEGLRILARYECYQGFTATIAIGLANIFVEGLARHRMFDCDVHALDRLGWVHYGESTWAWPLPPRAPT